MKIKKTSPKKNKFEIAVAGVIAALVLSVVLICFSVIGGKAKPAAEPVDAEPQTVEETAEPEPEEEEQLPEYYPFISQQLKDAHDDNDDVVGWLTVDGCDIDNRVFQSTDNDYYLRRNEDGKSDVWGCYFLDYINVHDDRTLFDRVSIIYGHSLGDTTESEKFSRLKKYRDKDFALEHPVIRFDLLSEEHDWQVFATCNIPISIDYIDPNPEGTKFDNTFDYIMSHSFVDFGVDITSEDHILILSTCTSDENTRFIVASKLIEKED